MIRMTRNDLKRLGERCIRLPYADPVTNDCQKIGWNDDVYGWNYYVYTMEGFDGTIIEGCRSFPSWAITPTSEELEELHKAYQSDNYEVLVDLLGKVQGIYESND